MFKFVIDTNTDDSDNGNSNNNSNNNYHYYYYDYPISNSSTDYHNMGYPVQNRETGELDYIHCDNNLEHLQSFDEETGEPLSAVKLKVRYGKHKSFHIPRKYFRGTVCEEFQKQVTGEYKEVILPTAVPVTSKEVVEPKKPVYSRDYFMNLPEVNTDIIMGYNKSNRHLFLIPTLLCFNVYIYIFLVFLELFLHFWAHKKNDLNMNKEVYFRSPLHVLTSQFCARCRSESELDFKIFKMLNRQLRESRMGLLKNVSKVIS